MHVLELLASSPKSMMYCTLLVLACGWAFAAVIKACGMAIRYARFAPGKISVSTKNANVVGEMGEDE